MVCVCVYVNVQLHILAHVRMCKILFIANKLQLKHLHTHCTHFACVRMCKIWHFPTFAHINAHKLQLQHLHAQGTYFARVQMCELYTFTLFFENKLWLQHLHACRIHLACVRTCKCCKSALLHTFSLIIAKRKQPYLHADGSHFTRVQMYEISHIHTFASKFLQTIAHKLPWIL